MYTLKINWRRWEKVGDVLGQADETTLFVPAVEVRVHREIETGQRAEAMRAWDENGCGYFNYLSSTTITTGGCIESREDGGRLIEVIMPDGDTRWYLASLAWLLGPNGDTIERIAP